MNRLSTAKHALAACVAAGVMGASTLALAQGDLPSGALDVLKTASPNVTVEKQFDGPPGLEGFLISEGVGTPRVIVWMTDDYKHLIAGNVFDSRGRNLTTIAADHYKAENPVTLMVNSAVNGALRDAIGSLKNNGQGQPERSEQPTEEQGSQIPAEKVSAALEEIKGLRSEGRLVVQQPASDGRPVATIFYDPHCGHCKTLHKGMAGIDWTDVGIQWVPVSLFGSPDKSALAIQEGDAAAINRSMTNVPVLKPVEDEAFARIEANTAILEQTLMPGTPIVVIDYQDGDSREDTALLGPDASDLAKATAPDPNANKEEKEEEE